MKKFWKWVKSLFVKEPMCRPKAEPAKPVPYAVNPQILSDKIYEYKPPAKGEYLGYIPQDDPFVNPMHPLNPINPFGPFSIFDRDDSPSQNMDRHSHQDRYSDSHSHDSHSDHRSSSHSIDSGSDSSDSTSTDSSSCD